MATSVSSAASDDGTRAFLDGFPFSTDLARLFAAQDLLEDDAAAAEGSRTSNRGRGGPRDDPRRVAGRPTPLLLTLREPEVHACLAELSLGKRKRVWRELRAWRERMRGEKQKEAMSSVKKHAAGSYFSDDSSDFSSSDNSASDASDFEQESKTSKDKNKIGINQKKSSNSDVHSSSSKSHLSGNGLTTMVHSNGNLNPAISCFTCLQRSKHHLASALEPERWKTFIAFLYVLVVSWLSAFVMVIVHDRVPDMEKYPPLPDLFLDNLPHIPWAFEMCELTGMILLTVWTSVCMLHKHRFILMRRFFSISGTIFLLRCVTMLITSLSVPGKHLACAPRPYGDIWNKLYNAYVIWTGAGMTLQGVRTCGDYMFSGHTVSLTLLNFFITEYTSRRIYFLHTFTWICNVFGVFFILAAHEHYSIDVFIAFYISSRLFLYYHTLANNKGGSKVGQRAWFYFPLFYFFESKIEGKIPNEFEYPLTACDVREYADKVWKFFRGGEVMLNEVPSVTAKKVSHVTKKENKKKNK